MEFLTKFSLISLFINGHFVLASNSIQIEIVTQTVFTFPAESSLTIWFRCASLCLSRDDCDSSYVDIEGRTCYLRDYPGIKRCIKECVHLERFQVSGYSESETTPLATSATTELTTKESITVKHEQQPRKVCDEICNICEYHNTFFHRSQYNDCHSRLHVQTLEDATVTVSSKLRETAGPYQSRLFTESAWIAKVNNENQWIQVDFEREMKITGVLLQGRTSNDQWITSFKIAFSRNNGNFQYSHALQGPHENRNVRCVLLETPVITNRIRIIPLTWKTHIVIRFDLLGCKIDNSSSTDESGYQTPYTLPSEEDNINVTRLCSYQNGLFQLYGATRCHSRLHVITSNHTTLNTSSVYTQTYHGLSKAALFQDSESNKGGSWTAGTIDIYQWYEVQFDGNVEVNGILLQGRNNSVNQQWVKFLDIAFSDDGKDFSYTEPMEGSYNSNSVQCRIFTTPIRARYFRVRPLMWEKHISMRFDFLGCML